MKLTNSLWMAALSLAAIFCTRTAPQLSEIDAQPLAIQTTISIDSTVTDPGSLEEAPASVCIGCDHTINYSSTDETTPEPTGPVVRAVMFWINGCPSCHNVLENVLPPLQEKYGDQFQVRLIEVVGLDDYEHLVSVAASLGVPKDQVFVPFLILDEHALIGSDQIQSELPGLIQEYLARGGLDWPSWLDQAVETPATAVGTGEQVFTGGVARAVVFTTLDCHTCQGELAVILRPLVEKYGDRFEYRSIDIRTSEQVEYIYELAASYGFEREQTDLPMIMIGDHVLMGDRIEAELPVLVDGYLAAGGIDYPLVPEPPGQATTTPEPTPTAVEVLLTPAKEQKPDGFVLAIAVLAAMGVALVYSIIRLILAGVRGGDFHPVPAWQAWAIPILALIGLGVAGYMSYVETQLVHAVCGPVGDCNAVQSSPYARLFGVLPVGLLGVAGYLAILAAWLWGRLKGDRNSGYAALAVTGMSLFGTLFSLYLTYLEPFVIQAVCLWCLSSAILITLLLLFSLRLAINAIRLKKYR